MAERIHVRIRRLGTAEIFSFQCLQYEILYLVYHNPSESASVGGFSQGFCLSFPYSYGIMFPLFRETGADPVRARRREVILPPTGAAIRDQGHW